MFEETSRTIYFDRTLNLSLEAERMHDSQLRRDWGRACAIDEALACLCRRNFHYCSCILNKSTRSICNHEPALCFSGCIYGITAVQKKRTTLTRFLQYHTETRNNIFSMRGWYLEISPFSQLKHPKQTKTMTVTKTSLVQTHIEWYLILRCMI